ncbi:MAG: SRPBCC family protein [Methylococcaceae bacterium]
MMKLPFDSTRPVIGKASTRINRPAQKVFQFIGQNFFDNYPKWALEVVKFEPLDGRQMFIGAKAKQLRIDQGQAIESIFEITDYQSFRQLTFRGINEPYRNSYVLEGETAEDSTILTFCFELLELELFMRPFEKLIRSAIEEGAENTVENIKKLLSETDSEAKIH